MLIEVHENKDTFICVGIVLQTPKIPLKNTNSRSSFLHYEVKALPMIGKASQNTTRITSSKAHQMQIRERR